MKAGPWIFEDGGAMRVAYSWDGKEQLPNIVKNRVAFIEKTPRIRIRSEMEGYPDWLNWASGDKGNGPTDPDSLKWCDLALIVFGYELVD